MFCLLLAPQDPTLAFVTLLPMFMLDAVLNAGILIANNGFLLKNSPTQGRTMFIASGTATAGIVGGVTAIVSGYALTKMNGWTYSLGSATITGYQVLFAISMLLRFGALPMVKRIQEPSTHPPMPVFSEQVVIVSVRSYRSIEGGLNRLRRDAPTSRKGRVSRPDKVTHSAP